MLSVLDFITAVYILVDDLMQTMLRGVRLRRRGVAPRRSDSEVVTMEIVGEVLQIDEDKGLSIQLLPSTLAGVVPRSGLAVGIRAPGSTSAFLSGILTGCSR